MHSERTAAIAALPTRKPPDCDREASGLKAGEIVLSGSFIRPIEARQGDTINADYGPMGTVSCHFG